MCEGRVRGVDAPAVLALQGDLLLLGSMPERRLEDSQVEMRKISVHTVRVRPTRESVAIVDVMPVTDSRVVHMTPSRHSCLVAPTVSVTSCHCTNNEQFDAVVVQCGNDNVEHLQT